MSDAPGWSILQIVATRLAAISVANGYYTEAGATVDTERVALDEADTFPRIALAEETMSTLAQTTAAINSAMVLCAEGYIPVGVDDAEYQAHRLKADITRALGRIKSSDFEGIENVRVTLFEVKGDRPTLRSPEGVAFIVVQVRATVTFAEYIPPASG
jgi:hypothetical protein